MVKESAIQLDDHWDHLGEGIYQSITFLQHLETYNFCDQKYYQLYDDNALVAGAVVYSLKVNVLTFAKYSIKLPMRIIGIPASVDASGFVGDSVFHEKLIRYITEKENGFILCLNYADLFQNMKLIQMETLPTLIHNTEGLDWETYLNSLRHHYRRRIIKARKKFKNIVVRKNTCTSFTREHYQLYLQIMEKTKTKLEILPFGFFSNLPEEFSLISCYDKDQLITWHITIVDKKTYYFLFGGINYELRDTYESYVNNLIQIIKDGMNLGCIAINLGQTAELAKKRFGAQPVKKKMFLYHHNHIIRGFFKMIKGALSYNEKVMEANVYKPTALRIDKKQGCYGKKQIQQS